MEKKSKIYCKNKLLKMYSGMAQKGTAVLFLFTKPKNFRKNMDEAEQAVAKQKSKKTRSMNLIFFLINILVLAIILVVQISQQEDMSISTLLNSDFSPPILLFTLFVWFISQMSDTYRVNLLVKMSSGRSRPFLSYKTHAIGKYYDSITPMATGGQPFQIFYLKNRGLNVASAISVPMGKWVINQLCISVVWTVCLIVGFATNAGFTKILCLVGWIINSFLMVAIILVSVNQKVGKKIVFVLMRFLHKIRLVKDYEKRYNQVLSVVTDFQVTVRNFVKDAWNFAKLLGSNLFSMLLNYSMAFLVYCIMVGWFDFSMYWQILLLSVMIDMAASFVPLPGGTGVNELSFAALFASIISPAALLTWALIIWRFFTYYIFLVQGLLVMTYDNVLGNRKYLWLKKKWELEAESMTFEQDKIHEYNTEKKKKTGQIF